MLCFRLRNIYRFSVVTLNGNELYSAEKSYDASGRSAGYSYKISGLNTRTSSSTYDQYNRLSQETTAGGDTVSYTYDGFGRVITKSTGGYSYHYEYLTSGDRTSTLVSKLTVKYAGNPIKAIEYTYDNLGNILTEDDGVTYRQYTYDSLNQLSSELCYNKSTNTGKVKYYSYSKSGNVSYYEYDFVSGLYVNLETSGHSYGSGTDWKEMLTSYGGTPITYDANGNPLSYYNGQSYTFTWQKGRQLASAVTGTDTITYAYDVNGRRISKTVNGTTHTYTYDGMLLLCDMWDDKYIEYFYDSSGSPYALNYYDGTTSAKYFFIKNLEGDILELKTSTNVLVARYIYDGWGKILEVRDIMGYAITDQTHIANLNSLRYRGYVYDTEMGFYYVSSRYYDPEIGRWINADSQLNTSLGILGLNQFSYCLNNPVNMVDYGGNKPGDLFDTMDEAARDFAEYINEKSISVDCEYGSFIYKKTVWVTQTITYYNPNIFGNNFLSKLWNYIFRGGLTKTITKRVKVTKYSYVEPKKGTAHSVSIPINWFGARKKVAEIHTHGAYSPGYSNDNFSSADLNNWINYLVTPLGTVRKYDPADGSDIIIYYDVPYDSNHPGRK